MEEEKEVINIDGDSSSSASESGSDEDEPISVSSGKGGSTGEDSDAQSWNGSGDESGKEGSPIEVVGSSQASPEREIQVDSEDEISSVVAASSHQALQFLQDSDDEKEVTEQASDSVMRDVFGEDSHSEGAADQEAGPSKRLRMSEEEGSDINVDSEEEEELGARPVKKSRVIEDDDEDQDDVIVADNSRERSGVDDVSEDEEVGGAKDHPDRRDSGSPSGENETAGVDGETQEYGSTEARVVLDKEGSDEEDDDDVKGEEEMVQLQEEVAALGGEVEQGEGEEEEEEGVEEREQLGGEDSDEEPVEDRKLEGMSDWDLMMQRRKAAMDRARRKRRGDGDETIHDDMATALILKMKEAAEQDRQLNIARKAATKKIQLLPTVMAYIKKASLQTIFVECGILSAFSEWLSPLPDHSLPHLKIRESILDTLKTFPTPDSSILKSSKIGKSVMLIYQHPKETRKNREKAGKLINEWARPIFGLASDFKMISREERESQDYANLSQEARKRISTGERRKSQDEDVEQPQKPGDKGWVGRARVPMPSTKGYVVRPKWNVDHEFHKKGSSKKALNRYEKHLRKKKQEQTQKTSTHAVSISVEGRHMPL